MGGAGLRFGLGLRFGFGLGFGFGGLALFLVAFFILFFLFAFALLGLGAGVLAFLALAGTGIDLARDLLGFGIGLLDHGGDHPVEFGSLPLKVFGGLLKKLVELFDNVPAFSHLGLGGEYRLLDVCIRAGANVVGVLVRILLGHLCKLFRFGKHLVRLLLGGADLLLGFGNELVALGVGFVLYAFGGPVRFV